MRRAPGHASDAEIDARLAEVDRLQLRMLSVMCSSETLPNAGAS